MKPFEKFIRYLETDPFHESENPEASVMYLIPEIHNSPKIRLNEIARYIDVAKDSKLDWSKDIPNIAPPWESFYFEYRLNKVALLDDDDPAQTSVNISGYLQSSRDLDTKQWKVAVIYLVELLGRGSYMNMVLFELHPDGSLVLKDDKFFQPKIVSDHPQGKQITDIFFLNPLLLGNCFCHCKKQVSIKTEEVPAKIRKKQARQGRFVIDRWHTLNIDPVKKLLALSQTSSGGDIKQALHLCRGHFRDYRNGKGLFGKYRGLYWVGQHMKGSEEFGTVGKDYNVKSPSKAA